MNQFIISISNDGANWNEIYSENDDQPVYRGDDIGLVVDLNEYYITWFIRMTFPRKSATHSASFNVFG